MPFADLHCHPAFWSFNKLSPPDDKGNSDYHIWNITLTKQQQRQLAAGKRGTYAQSDFASLSGGDVLLAFASIHPIEKGFFMGNRRTRLNAVIIQGALNLLVPGWPKWLRRVVAYVLRDLNSLLSLFVNNEAWGRDLLQKWVLNFSIERIDFFQGTGYDYFSEMEREYEFYKTFQQTAPRSPAPASTKPYKLITANDDLETIIQKQDTIAVVLSVEGFHALALEPKPTPDPEKGEYLQRVPDVRLQERIRKIKEWGVFYVTFSHHYNNEMAGHAHSLPELLAQITDQSALMNMGLQQDAEPYLRQLLSITPDNEPDQTAGRRVLVDVKHLSALSRNDFYEKIIRPYNQKHPDDPIPVIASHCGYYGPVEGHAVVTLKHLSERAKDENDDSFDRNFCHWNINLCDEDIAVIVASRGLIGLSFDQRIMGEQAPHGTSPEYWINVMARQITAIVASAIASVPNRPEQVWDCLCIGTDFDGLIDPLDAFSTATKFGTFTSGLLRFLKNLPHDYRTKLFLNANPYTPEAVVEKIAFQNACRFTVKHFK